MPKSFARWLMFPRILKLQPLPLWFREVIEMQITLQLDEARLDRLRALALSDHRSPESVASILVSHGLNHCKSLQDLRRIVDDLPGESGTVRLTKPLQGGVIRSLMHLLEEAKRNGQPRTAEELLADLRAMCGDASMYTVRAQLSRLPGERNFPISKFGSGKEKRYAAA